MNPSRSLALSNHFDTAAIGNQRDTTMLTKVVAVIAILVAGVQTLLMGMIGYPLARRSPEGMERFHQSGFTWWVISLVLVSALGAYSSVSIFAPFAPASHQPSLLHVAVVTLVAVVVIVLVELGGEAVIHRSSSAANAKESK